ncbi:MAG: sigma-70 family RNA polymerase sigma factor [Lawsonibacter sp.]|nr:sigma-70 family RNA polymerase sigma factor [Lawsonibacter sp.]
MKHDDITAMVETYSDMIMRIAYQHCFNKSDSEDITQEVFIRLMSHQSLLLKDESTIKAWLIRVTVNLCKDWNKSAWYRRTTSLEECENGAFCWEWENDESAALEALKGLRPVYRTVLYMYYYEGYKIREIAQILGLKENTVSSGLTRARKKLRDILTEGDDASWERSIAICSPK